MLLQEWFQDSDDVILSYRVAAGMVPRETTADANGCRQPQSGNHLFPLVILNDA